MAKTQNLQVVNGEWVYLDYDARTITQSAKDAIEVAKEIGEPITMAFNAARVRVTGNETSPRQISDAYFVECRRMEEEYAASPAVRQAAAHAQKTIDTIVGKLDEAITHGIAGVVGWMADYAAHADNKNIDRRNEAILLKLKAAGYQSDAFVGDEKAKTDLRTKGLFIIGQCLSNMEENMPPLPGACVKFIGEYTELRKTAFIPVMHPLTLNGKAPPPDTIPLVQKLKLKAPQS